MVSPLALLWLQIMPGLAFLDPGPKRDIWPEPRPRLEQWAPPDCSLYPLLGPGEMSRHLWEMRRAFERSLKRDPALGGRLTLHLAVDTQGQVTSALAQDSTVQDAELIQDIESIARRWRFAPCQERWEVSVPLVFSAG
jgi:hypothetical protein